MKEVIINLSEFIRLKICIFIFFIGISSYLIFNPLNIGLISVALTSFFGAAGAYAYNNLTDKEEDLINRKNINPFTLSKNGLVIAFTCFLLGLFFSLFLSIHSILFYLFGIIVSIVYSFFRIKKYFLIKNLYTGFGVSIAFLIGAANINIKIFWYYFLFSFFIIIISIISDLRDYKGDRFSHIKTLPISLGYNTAKKFVFLLLSIFSLLVLFFSNLFVLLPFVFLMFYFLYKNNPSLAHSYGGASFIFLTFWLII
jgi:4-hydroxybenzoate polyprenyltransferase